MSVESFEWVFGPKQDRWLEYTVAGLLTANGLTQLLGAASADGVAHARRLGVGTAATLLAIDVIYVPRGRLRPTYLLDAAMELAWIAAWGRRRPTSREPRGGGG